MATDISSFSRAYSVTAGGLKNIPPFVINTTRAPAASDRANIGTLWNYIANNSVWMLTSATNGNYNWTPLTNNIGVISSLQAADGTVALPVNGQIAFPNTVITANTNIFTNILTSVQPNNSNNFLINLTPELNLRSAQNDMITLSNAVDNDLPIGINCFRSKGTLNAPSPVVAGTALVNFTQFGWTGTNPAPQATGIKSRVPAGATIAANCIEGELVFSTAASNGGAPPVSALGERMIINKNGLVSMPFQSSFYAYPTANQDDVTGNAAGTTYIVQYNSVAGPLGHNIGSNYNTANGIYTAPIDGRYLFTAAVFLKDITDPGMTVATFGFAKNTVNVGFQNLCNPLPIVYNPDGYLQMQATIMLQLAAGDQIRTQLLVRGGAANTVDVIPPVAPAGPPNSTFFAGQLLS